MALTGRTVALLLIGVPVAVIWSSTTAVRWWWLTILVLVGIDVATAVAPDKLGLTRHPVMPVRLGDSSHTDLVVTNTTGRQVSVLIRDAWQPSAGAGVDRHRAVLPPGASQVVRTQLTPTRRGDRRADRVTLRVPGPLGLAARQGSVPVPGTVRALPPFPSRRHLPSLLRSLRRLDGRALVRVRGQGTEFDSLRDYVDGDDVRSIDWRASARRIDPRSPDGRGGVVVRTWRPERDRHVVIVLDTSRTAAARVGDTPRLDAAMDAALLLTALAARAGDRVDLVAGDRRVHTLVTGNRRRDPLHAVTNALAPVDPELVEADWRALAATVTDRARHRAFVVLLTPLEPAAIEEGLLPVLEALTRKHLVLLASVRDPGLPDLANDVADAPATYRAAAVEQALGRRERTASVLRRLGVHVLDESPDDLPHRLCTGYLALKDRGLL